MNRTLYSQIAAEVSKGIGVSRTIYANLATKSFDDGDVRTIAIEQNPKTNSQWARLAQTGHKVVQFKQGNRYVAVAVDGELHTY